MARQSPPRNGIFRPKLRYAHQGGRNPPVIVIHGNALDKVPESYRRYLEHVFREVFKLQGTPLRIQFNVSKNPFADRKPPEQNRRKPKPKVPISGKPKPKAASESKGGTASEGRFDSCLNIRVGMANLLKINYAELPYTDHETWSPNHE